MNFRDFLRLAATLANGSVEAEWRSAVSRVYYAAFHVGCELLRDLGFVVPQADRAHAYLWLRLENSGHPDVRSGGRDLKAMRRDRNRADYDGRRLVDQKMASDSVRDAQVIIAALDAAHMEPTRTQITDAMRIYERDVLKDVTWHP